MPGGVTGGGAVVRVPATSANLGPGYDTFGVALTLPLVAAAVARTDQRVITSGEGAGDVPTDESNLIWRSLVRFCEHHDVAVPDVTLDIDNAIPLERGLGSSSAAIVAGLTLGRVLTGVPCRDLDVATLATGIEGHPDNVVPAVLGGLTVTARTDAGDLVIRRIAPTARLRPVAFVPEQRQNTAAARGVLPDVLPAAAAADQAGRAGHVLGALAGIWPADAALGGDHLHEPPRLEIMSASGALLRDLRAVGCHAWLSGAGPTVAAAPARDDALDGCLEVAARHGFAVHALDWDLSGAVGETVERALPG